MLTLALASPAPRGCRWRHWEWPSERGWPRGREEGGKGPITCQPGGCWLGQPWRRWGLLFTRYAGGGGDMRRTAGEERGGRAGSGELPVAWQGEPRGTGQGGGVDGDGPPTCLLSFPKVCFQSAYSAKKSKNWTSPQNKISEVRTSLINEV